MIYGLYLSATGIMANSYRQDVLANNLANSETVGFKRNFATFTERRTAAQELNEPGEWSQSPLENIGGGMLVSKSDVDRQQGDLEQTGNALDMAIRGDGFFAVTNGLDTHLTRNGQMVLDGKGQLVMANARSQKILDVNHKPITLEAGRNTTISDDGLITQDGQAVARIGLFDVPDRNLLAQQGGTLISYPYANDLRQATGELKSGFVEHSNVDPTTELTELMDAQRQLEANANMIRYQDSTLQRLVNDVGKIS